MTPGPFGTWFEGLEGSWSISRAVSDGTLFHGRARFSRNDPRSYAVEEEGLLQVAGGTVLKASRHWRWSWEGDARLSIWFGEPEDALYHALCLNRDGDCWTGEASHLCLQDLYQGTYRLEYDRMIIRQQVKGPEKNYELTSTYSK